ncbi:hypothetical protein [Luteolibacter sp. Populi]|uniref:hypothetical protein n=1 Tax=Luteolibacter sp. Populi TaxID=3230487 RepID=UPI0034658ACD
MAEIWGPAHTAEGESAWQQFGNWENVFRYLEEKKYEDALEHADYLIVQIDSDQSEHVNFGVSQRENGQELSAEEIVDRVAGRLRQFFEPGHLEFYGERIIFAICVRDLECWLLPLWDESKASKTVGCLAALNRALSRQNQTAINPEEKCPELYDRISKDYRKKDELLRKGVRNPSLKLFLEALDSRRFQGSGD